MATLVFAPKADLHDVDVTWALPDGCQPAGGTLTRHVPTLRAGQRQSQALLFTCADPAATGKVHVSWTGPGLSGQGDAAF